MTTDPACWKTCAQIIYFANARHVVCFTGAVCRQNLVLELFEVEVAYGAVLWFYCIRMFVHQLVGNGLQLRLESIYWDRFYNPIRDHNE